MPCLIDAAARDPEMGQLLERLGQERQALIMTIVERAEARGELPADLDRGVLVGSIVGPIVFRKVMQRLPLDAAYLEGCLDVAITGLIATAPVTTGRR